MTSTCFRVLSTFAMALCALGSAAAQTPINAPGAMQPSTNTGIWHEMPMYREIGSDPTTNVREGKEYIALTQIAYGLRNNLSLQFDAPIVFRDLKIGSRPGTAPGSFSGGTTEDDESGLGDMTLLAKYRIYQNDPGPTETTRFSLIGGLQIPGTVAYKFDSSNDAWDPIIGCVFSTVFGRNGINADVLWEFYTGDDHENNSNSLRYDLSYLFRLYPAAYTEESTGALYAVAELNGVYGTNGDHEIFLSPGLMYESKKYTLDATLMLPVYQNVHHRAETEFIVGVGVRISF